MRIPEALKVTSTMLLHAVVSGVVVQRSLWKPALLVGTAGGQLWASFHSDDPGSQLSGLPSQ